MNIVMKEDLIEQGYEAITLDRALDRVKRWYERTDDEELGHMLANIYRILMSCANNIIGREVFYSSKKNRYPVYVPITQRYCSYEADIVDNNTVTFKKTFCDDNNRMYWATADDAYSGGFVEETNNLKDLYDTYKGYIIL